MVVRDREVAVALRRPDSEALVERFPDSDADEVRTGARMVERDALLYAVDAYEATEYAGDVARESGSGR